MQNLTNITFSSMYTMYAKCINIINQRGLYISINYNVLYYVFNAYNNHSNNYRKVLNFN